MYVFFYYNKFTNMHIWKQNHIYYSWLFEGGGQSKKYRGINIFSKIEKTAFYMDK